MVIEEVSASFGVAFVNTRITAHSLSKEAVASIKVTNHNFSLAAFL